MQTTFKTLRNGHPAVGAARTSRDFSVVFPEFGVVPRGLGGKAAALNALSDSGLPIPAWFAVIPQAGSNAQGDGGAMAITAGLRRQIADAVTALEPDKKGLAVRSSAVEEDGRGTSFAGQFRSVLCVSPDKVVDAVTAVWRSAHSRNLEAYCTANNVPLPTRLPTVIVQRMVDARVSGVAFGADAVTGRRTVRIVSAVRGTGDRLVSGEARTDTWTVTREGIIRQISRCGTPHPALTRRQVAHVAAMVAAAGRHFDCPQDIEWAFDGETFYLLQSRPITTLRSVADPDAPGAVWDNTNIVESYGGVTTPLTFSFVRRGYEEVYKAFARSIGVEEAEIDRQHGLFESMIGLVNGRIYYNLTNWHRLLSSLPGSRFTWRFHREMIGVRREIPQSRAKTESAVRGIAGLVRLIRAILTWHIAFERRKHAFSNRVERSLGFAGRALGDLRLDELTDRYRFLEQELLSRWDAPVVNDLFAMIHYGILKFFTTAWCGSESLHNELLAGEGDVVSVEPVKRIEEIAGIVKADPVLLQTLAEGTPREINAELRKRLRVGHQIRDYLSRYGDRCANELKLESLTFTDNPGLFYRSIASTAAKMDGLSTRNADRAARRSQLRAEAEKRMDEILGRSPLKRWIFRWVLRQARARIRDRENLRFARTRAFGVCRRIFVEIGRRLAAERVLQDPRDVFYLEVDEILRFVDGTSTTCNLDAVATVRKVEFDRYEATPPPSHRFETKGCVHLGNTFRAEHPADTARSDLKGLGCSPGRVIGPVRHVRDPLRCSLRGDEILVAESTDPGWVILFANCKGILVERGSVLSHVAIVAREMGIPVIVAVEGLTGLLHDGERIEMDGRTGLIKRVKESEGESNE